MNWMPRDQNSQADFFSKIVDFDDYSVIDEVFFHLEELWSPHSLDRFACSYNAKLLRFNSRFLQPGTEAVDAYSQDWSSDNNWLVPPTTLIGRVLCHMHNCKAVGTLIVLTWKSAQFWPLLCSDGVHLNSFVKDCLFLPNRPDLFVKGRAKNTFYLVPKYLSLHVLQFGLTSLTIAVFPLWAFVPLPKGGALCADLEGFAQVCLTWFSIVYFNIVLISTMKKTIFL